MEDEGSGKWGRNEEAIEEMSKQVETIRVKEGWCNGRRMKGIFLLIGRRVRVIVGSYTSGIFLKTQQRPQTQTAD